MSTNFQNTCIDYLTELRAIRGNTLATDELSLRPALDSFLKRASKIFNRPVIFLSEGKKLDVGSPDFTVTRKDLPIGYIEAEAYAADLDNLTGHAKEQNERFRTNLDNFLLTNYLEFHLYLGGDMVDSARLPTPPDSRSIKVSEADAEALAILLERFLSGQLPSIGQPRELAVHLARRTRQMRNETTEALAKQMKDKNGDLYGQYQAFREVLLPDLTEDRFADMYAQTVAYGLFAARCTVPSALNFSRRSAADLVPRTNPFLRRLFQQIAAHDLDERVAWIADDIAQLLARASMETILADFGANTKQQDPVVHFYETFLTAYDPELRELRGVYYTPEPVVSYIVRSIDRLLKTRFNKPMGLADENTLILDPATGTGSFLFAVVNRIREMVNVTYGAGTWNEYVEKYLLPRLFGFELLVAPYAVAHLKLGLLFQESGYDFSSDQRVGIYLTNTLDEAIKKSELLMGQFISDEANQAAAIKQEDPIMVVLGNPPYSITTQNKGDWIRQLLSTYKQNLNEKKHNLDDDYVKFIRFAQWRIEQNGEGIIGYITNHGFLYNLTFRVMRQSLLRTFNEIYICDLHGSSWPKEIAPDGGIDENVFDIKKGVAIFLCVKERGNQQLARVYHADLWGSRDRKYDYLTQTEVNDTEWTELKLTSPFYRFVPQNDQFRDEYESCCSVVKMFRDFGSGLNTDRNDLCIDFEREALLQRMQVFFSGNYDEEFRETYGIYASSSYDPEERRKRVDFSIDCVRTCLHRPFDWRSIYYQQGFTSRPVFEVMRHVLAPNLGMVLTRQSKEPFAALCASCICTHKIVAVYDRSFMFPLYLYPNPDELALQTERLPNFSPKFLKALAEKLTLPQIKPHGLPEGITPEDIFHYAYAVFHSPTYRERYAEFLKIDFPRLPLTSDLNLFRDLAALGRELVALHLVDTSNTPLLNTPINPFPVVGNNEVEKVRYNEGKQQVYINKTQYFKGVSTEIWEFRIGGYQVCEKWLKDRKGRKLPIKDIQHYQRILLVLGETIRLMVEIDERIPAFPIE